MLYDFSAKILEHAWLFNVLCAWYFEINTLVVVMRSIIGIYLKYWNLKAG